MAPTLTSPRNSDELAEMLADPARAKQIMETPKSLADFIQEYANTQQGDGTDLKRLVDEGIERGFANFLRENGAGNIKRPALHAAMPDPYMQASKKEKSKGLYNKAAIGAAADGLFESSGDYFHAIWRGSGSRDSAEMQAKLAQLKNFSSDVPADGGFLIPETLRSEMLRVALEQAIVRPRARVIPMETLRVPFPAIDSTSNVNSVYGGITTYWTEEGGKLTGSKPKFGRVVLDAKKLTAYTEIPNELLTDSLVSLTSFIDEAFPEALAFAEDQAFLTGDGVGKPLGILNGNAAVSVTRTTSSKVDFLDIVNMYARMLPQSISRAVWVASHDVWPQLAQMALTRGTDGIASPAMWMTNGQAIDAPPLSLMGLPVIRSEKVPSLGNAGDLSLVDFGFYLIGDRQAMQAKQSDDFKFDTDEVAFRVIERLDGRPWLQSAITPANGSSNTLSPIVKLAA